MRGEIKTGIVSFRYHVVKITKFDTMLQNEQKNEKWPSYGCKIAHILYSPVCEAKTTKEPT